MARMMAKGRCWSPTAVSRKQEKRVVNLSNLKQGAQESVTDFGVPVAHIVDDIKVVMPAASYVPTGVAWENSTIAKHIFEQWICKFGTPLEFVSDNGKTILQQSCQIIYIT